AFLFHEALVDQFLVSLEDGQWVQPVFRRDVAYGRKGVTIAQDPLQNHCDHPIPQLTVDRSIFVPFGVHCVAGACHSLLSAGAGKTVKCPPAPVSLRPYVSSTTAGDPAQGAWHRSRGEWPGAFHSVPSAASGLSTEAAKQPSARASWCKFARACPATEAAIRIRNSTSSDTLIRLSGTLPILVLISHSACEARPRSLLVTYCYSEL